MGQKGNIAQLVEHCLCKAGAVGSNPTISTLLFELPVLLPAGVRALPIFCSAFGGAKKSLWHFFATAEAKPLPRQKNASAEPRQKKAVAKGGRQKKPNGAKLKKILLKVF